MGSLSVHTYWALQCSKGLSRKGKTWVVTNYLEFYWPLGLKNENQVGEEGGGGKDIDVEVLFMCFIFIKQVLKYNQLGHGYVYCKKTLSYFQENDF